MEKHTTKTTNKTRSFADLSIETQMAVTKIYDAMMKRRQEEGQK